MLNQDLKTVLRTTKSHFEALNELGLKTVKDLLLYFPWRYDDESTFSTIAEFSITESKTVSGKLTKIFSRKTSTGKTMVRAVFSDSTGSVDVMWFNQSYLKQMLRENMTIILTGKIKWNGRRGTLMGPKHEIPKSGVDLIHTGRVVPVYNETAKISSKCLRQKIQPILYLAKFFQDPIPAELVQEYGLMPLNEAIIQVHFPDSDELLQRARHRLGFEELFMIQIRSIYRKKIWQEQAEKNKKSINLDTKVVQEFLELLPFELTRAQKKVVDENWKEYKLLSLTKKGVIERDLENSKGKFPEFFNTYKVVNKNDLIFCLYDIQETPRTIGLSDLNGMITGSYNIFQTNQNSKFVYYWFLMIDDVKGLKPYYTGMRNVVRNETFLSIKILLPPLQEQELIVKYLDDKTSIIDKLLSTKERKIELLKEQRTSLINEVITKGLNPNVKMKDSGVEWIGEIPESWNNTNLRYYVNKVGSGITPRGGSEVYVDEGIIFIRSQNVHFNGLKLDDVSRITSETHLGMSGSKVIFNDLLLNITGGSIGRCCVVLNEDEMNVNQHVCIIRTKKDKLSPFFLNYILQSKVGQTQVDYFQTGGNREGLTGENIKNFKISFPNIQEQQEIVEYLDTHTKEIDDLVSMEQKKIELLKEYRQSLISEVITGKIKVVE
jgi:type I restriction enzyme S subunit